MFERKPLQNRGQYLKFQRCFGVGGSRYKHAASAHKVLVLDMGRDRLEAISRLADIDNPFLLHLMVVTCVGSSTCTKEPRKRGHDGHPQCQAHIPTLRSLLEALTLVA